MVTVSIGKAELRRTVRQPLFYILLGVFGVLIFLSQFFILFTFGEETTMLREVGLSSILMCGLILSLFLSAESISAEEESRTLPMLLARPVKRYQIVLGKFLGAVSATFAALSVLTALFILILIVRGEEVRSGIVISIIAAYAQSALVASVAIFLSTLVPFTANVVICSLLFIVGNILPPVLSNTTWGQFSCVVTLSLLPNFSNFNFTKEIACDLPIPLTSLFWALLYAGAYTSASLSVAILSLHYREAK